MAVVKANAYGHGLVKVARAATRAGAAWCGTARLEEALAIRKAGVACQLFVLGYVTPQAIPDAIQANISLPVFQKETALAYAAQARAVGKPINVHVKIDSGMGRLGIFPEDGLEFVRWLKSLDGLQVEGLFTHFARADEPAQPATHMQLQRFLGLVETLQSNHLRPCWVHAANSAATVHFPDGWLDLVRPGIAIYGLSPSSQAPLPSGLLPALTWKTRLCSFKLLPPGHGIGYGHRYTTAGEELIGAIAAGYADGFRRRPGNMVLIRGKRVPVVGSVCMDQSMIQLDSVPEACMNDEVVLLGRQGNENISAEELAARWETINYDVLTGLAARLTRTYIGE
jgi:alanine racemase